MHKKHPKMAAKEVTMKLSKRWKSMEEDEKVQFVQYDVVGYNYLLFSIFFSSPGTKLVYLVIDYA